MYQLADGEIPVLGLLHDFKVAFNAYATISRKKPLKPHHWLPAETAIPYLFHKDQSD